MKNWFLNENGFIRKLPCFEIDVIDLFLKNQNFQAFNELGDLYYLSSFKKDSQLHYRLINRKAIIQNKSCWSSHTNDFNGKVID